MQLEGLNETMHLGTVHYLAHGKPLILAFGIIINIIKHPTTKIRENTW